MKRKLVKAFVLAGLLAPASAAGRQAQKSPKRADEGGAAVNSAAVLQQQAAVQTLQYLRNSAADIENARERVRLLLEVADAFWLTDKPQAREVFRLAIEQAGLARCQEARADVRRRGHHRERAVDEGLTLARQLKSKSLGYTAQAVVCRLSLSRYA